MVVESVSEDPVQFRQPRYAMAQVVEKNASVAAHRLSQFGKVAMLGIDYHHGNGQQEIFYRRKDVLTISIHGHPRFAYPYFSGFADERGEEEGAGFNVNYPLSETIDAADYLNTLRSALVRVRDFGPTYLVVCLGLDTSKGDPTGTWNLAGRYFTTIGEKIGRLQTPCLVVQEGGYNTRSIGTNAKSFFSGLLSGQSQSGSWRQFAQPTTADMRAPSDDIGRQKQRAVLFSQSGAMHSDMADPPRMR